MVNEKAGKSTWMTDDNFYESMKHFTNFVKCSQENSFLLVLDKHNISTIKFAKKRNNFIGISSPCEPSSTAA